MRLEVNGIGLEVEDRGVGPPVVLLHGWPDSHRLWRHQVAALTAAGYRCIAPDLRGFGESDRPVEVRQLSSWSGSTTSSRSSVGHLAAFRRAGLPQREKSWYMLLYQFEGVGEQWVAADDFASLRGAWLTHPDVDSVSAELSRDGALTAAPTMGAWSTGDGALIEAQMTGSAEFVKGPWRCERIEGAGHWLQFERPHEISPAPRLPTGPLIDGRADRGSCPRH